MDSESYVFLTTALFASPYPLPWYQFTAYWKATTPQNPPINIILVDDIEKKDKTPDDNIRGLNSCYFTKCCIMMVGLSPSSVGSWDGGHRQQAKITVDE